MNRRKALKRIAAGVVVTGAALGGYEYYQLVKHPSLATLEKNKALIASLADTLIPETDTPGAAAAKTEEYIILMLHDCTGKKSLNRFITGLEDLAAYTRRHYGKAYADCSLADREKILAHFEKSGKPWNGLLGKVQQRLMGASFFTTLKNYTVAGYCSSREGATRALRYEPVPGRFQGCILLERGQTAWATS